MGVRREAASWQSIWSGFLCSLSLLTGRFSWTDLFLCSLSPWVWDSQWLNCFSVLFLPECGILYDWTVSLFSFSLSGGFSLTDLFFSISLKGIWLTSFFVFYLPVPDWRNIFDWPVSLFSASLSRGFSLTDLFLCSLSPWVGYSLWLTCSFVLYLPE